MLSLIIIHGRVGAPSEKEGRARTICWEKTGELRSKGQAGRCGRCWGWGAFWMEGKPIRPVWWTRVGVEGRVDSMRSESGSGQIS